MAGKKTREGKNCTSQTIPHPPTIQSSMVVSRRVRWKASLAAAQSYGVKRGDVLSWFVSALSSTDARRLFTGVKIRCVDIWCMSASSNPFESEAIRLEWLSTYGPSKVVTATSMSIEPAYITSKPPRESLAGFYSEAGHNEGEVLLTLASGTRTQAVDLVLDFEVTGYMINYRPNSLSLTSSSLTAGQFYQNSLIGTDGTSLQGIPVGFNTVVAPFI